MSSRGEIVIGLEQIALDVGVSVFAKGHDGDVIYVTVDGRLRPNSMAFIW